MEYNYSPWWEDQDDHDKKSDQNEFIERKKKRAEADALRMNRREYFSLHLYQAMLSNNRAWDGVDGSWNIMARDAIAAADALIEELEDA